jgi:hypothetical protein
MTTLDTIRSRFTRMGAPAFGREYAGQWPFDAMTRAIDPDLWRAGAAATPTGYPAVYALAYDVAPDQSSAALCAAWRDPDGVAWVEVIEHRPGDGWVAPAVYKRSREHRTLTTGYDRIGPNRAVADRLDREARPRPRLHDLGTVDITAAAAQVMVDLTSGNPGTSPTRAWTKPRRSPPGAPSGMARSRGAGARACAPGATSPPWSRRPTRCGRTTCCWPATRTGPGPA